MPINILMPALSPTMEEGNLAKWLKAEGDSVAPGDLIAEIETDKATMEVEAVDEGTLGKIVIAEGTEGVKVNEVIAVLLEEGESADDIGDVSAKEESTKADDKKASDTDAEKSNGADKETKKDTGTDTGKDRAPKKEAEPEKSGGKSEGRIFASPLARRIAKDKGLDLASIKGSGPKGRIVKADVENAKPGAAPAAKGDAPAPAAAGTMPAGPSTETVRKMYADREHEEITLDGMRKTIAARLTEAKVTIPHFYLRRRIELDELLKLRSSMNAKGEARGIKLSVNDYIIKASALALQQVPVCNAVWAGDRVLQFKASDVAVAVAIEGGLFTPVIRDADTKSLSAISAEMKDLAARARDRKLAPHEYQGGSYAISNLGMMGIENFDAVINPPHASILAVGAGLQEPVVRDGAVAIRTMMSVTLSVDHRVIDGALGAEFLDALTGYLEDPLAMLM